MWSNTRAYKAAAADGASHIGLLLLVYDAVAADLLRSAQAVREADIQARCDASRHALLLLAHLESWLALLDDSMLAAGLAQFYAMLRTRIVHLGARPDSAAFEDLAQLVCSTRAVWHTREQQMLSLGQSVPSIPHAVAYAGAEPQGTAEPLHFLV